MTAKAGSITAEQKCPGQKKSLIFTALITESDERKGDDKMKKIYMAQFEATPEGNMLWLDLEDVRITATIKVPEICSESYGYLNLKDTIQRYLEIYHPAASADAEYPYKGQEHMLDSDAFVLGEMVEIDER